VGNGKSPWGGDQVGWVPLQARPWEARYIAKLPAGTWRLFTAASAPRLPGCWLADLFLETRARYTACSRRHNRLNSLPNTHPGHFGKWHLAHSEEREP